MGKEYKKPALKVEVLEEKALRKEGLIGVKELMGKMVWEKS